MLAAALPLGLACNEKTQGGPRSSPDDSDRIETSSAAPSVNGGAASKPADFNSTEAGSDRAAEVPSSWAIWPMPHPPDSGIAPPASYDTSQPGVAIDGVTGLMWQRDPSNDEKEVAGAVAHCADLDAGGYADWRLPTRIELVSLVDYTRDRPAIDAGVFAGTTGDFLSSSTLAGSRWRVGSDGATRLLSDSQAPAGRVRCVRRHFAKESPEPHYVLDESGDIATDRGTGLIWQRRPSATTFTFEGARTHCSELPLAGGGFRVPSMKELQTLLDETRAEAPLLDEDVFPDFPDTLNPTFWTSSRSARSTDQAWFVRGGSTLASAVDATVDTPFYVRCVR